MLNMSSNQIMCVYPSDPALRVRRWMDAGWFPRVAFIERKLGRIKWCFSDFWYSNTIICIYIRVNALRFKCCTKKICIAYISCNWNAFETIKVVTWKVKKSNFSVQLNLCSSHVSGFPKCSVLKIRNSEWKWVFRVMWLITRLLERTASLHSLLDLIA